MSIAKQNVILKLRDLGYRITTQKQTIIKNIIKYPNSTCKEIYYLSKEENPNINLSTVYRTVNTLEKMGFLQDRNISFTSL